MRIQGQLFIGIVLILVGLVFMAGVVFEVNVWGFCWPMALILFGLWMIFRPRLYNGDRNVDLRILGDIDRSGPWTVTDEAFWVGIGDIDLNLIHANLPPGETRLGFAGFIGDVDILVPAGMAVRLESGSFINDIEFLSEKQESFLAPVHFSSPGYETAERRLRLDANMFIGDIKVIQA